MPRVPAFKGLGRAAILAMVLIAAVPSSAHAFSKAIWGDVYRHGVNQFPMYRQLGVSIFETRLYWSEVAPTRPKTATNPSDRAYRWPADIQQAVTQARRFRMRVLIQIIGAPPWSNGRHAWNWAPHPGDFAAFAKAAARRYRSVHLWMIWGEPDRRPNFMPETAVVPGQPLTPSQQVAPHNYARILDASYGALKSVSGRNLVIGGCTYTTGDIDTLQWIENLRLPNGRPPRMDLYGHNPFSWRVPALSNVPSPLGEVQFPDLQRLSQWTDRYLRRGLPIFLSEWSIPTALNQEFNFYVDPPVAATWVADALRLSRSWKRIYALGWYRIYDDPPASTDGLITASGVRKPSFYAFAR